eukprot:6902943-Lingulodinium_polyedra.AAC.1
MLGRTGGPKRPITAAYAAAAASAMAGRTRGPAPFRERAVQDAHALRALATEDVQGVKAGMLPKTPRTSSRRSPPIVLR